MSASHQQLQRKLKTKLKNAMLKSKINHSQSSDKSSERQEVEQKTSPLQETQNTRENSKRLPVMAMAVKQSLSKGSGPAATGTAAIGTALAAKKSLKVEKKMSKLQAKMASKLSGSKFRWLNETLYTAKSDSSFELFSREPELFSIYHEGFASQVFLYT